MVKKAEFMLFLLPKQVISQFLSVYFFSRQQGFQELAGVTVFGICYYFRGAGGKNLSAAGTAFWAKIDDPVSGFDDVQIVLDDHDGIAVIGETMQYLEQHFDVLEMQAGCGLIKNVQRSSRVAFGEFERQLDALRFAAREGGG